MVYYIFRFLKSKLDSETDILLLFAGTRWGSKNFEQADIARNNAELKVIYGDICADRASHDTIDTASVEVATRIFTGRFFTGRFIYSFCPPPLSRETCCCGYGEPWGPQLDLSYRYIAAASRSFGLTVGHWAIIEKVSSIHLPESYSAAYNDATIVSLNWYRQCLVGLQQ